MKLLLLITFCQERLKLELFEPWIIRVNVNLIKLILTIYRVNQDQTYNREIYESNNQTSNVYRLAIIT